MCYCMTSGFQSTARFPARAPELAAHCSDCVQSAMACSTDALERIHAHTCDDLVSFQFEDGSTTDVAPDVVNSSSLLRNAVCSQPDDENVLLQLPRGILSNWLQYISTEDAPVLQALVVCFFLLPAPGYPASYQPHNARE